MLAGDPVLTPYNDSRDNLLRLLSEVKSFVLPVQALPSDITRSREFYFAIHPQWMAEQSSPTAANAQPEIQTLDQQMIELKIDPLQFTSSENPERLGISDYEGENRFVSYTLDAVSQFNAALLADTALTPDQRHTLALLRIKLFIPTIHKSCQKSLIAIRLAQTPVYLVAISRVSLTFMMVIMTPQRRISPPF